MLASLRCLSCLLLAHIPMPLLTVWQASYPPYICFTCHVLVCQHMPKGPESSVLTTLQRVLPLLGEGWGVPEWWPCVTRRRTPGNLVGGERARVFPGRKRTDWTIASTDLSGSQPPSTCKLLWTYGVCLRCSCPACPSPARGLCVIIESDSGGLQCTGTWTLIGSHGPTM